MVDFLPQTDALSNLQGICPDCGTMMYKRAASARLAVVSALLDVSFPLADPRIRERNFPSVNSDSSEEA